MINDITQRRGANEDIALRPLADLILQPVHLGSLAPDDDSRSGGDDVDLELIGGTLDFDGRDTGMSQPLLEIVPEPNVFMEELRVPFLRVPSRPPGLVNTEPKPIRMNFLTHGLPPNRAGPACEFPPVQGQIDRHVT